MMSITREDGQQVRGSDNVWERFLTRYGVPVGALVAVIYFFIWPVWDKGVQAMPVIKAALERHIEKVEIDDRLRFEQGVRFENYLRITCENTARTAAAAERCRSVR